jgi:hypothetical protein
MNNRRIKKGMAGNDGIDAAEKTMLPQYPF